MRLKKLFTVALALILWYPAYTSEMDLMSKTLLSQWRVTPDLAGTSKLEPTPSLLLENINDDAKSYWRLNVDAIELERQYKLTGKIKSSIGSSYRVYVECGKKDVWENFGNKQLYKGTGDWQNIEINFSFNKRPSIPYVIIQLIGRGDILAADFRLLERVKSSNVELCTSEFKSKWQNNDLKDVQYKFAEDNNKFKLEISQSADAKPYWIFKNLPVKSGKYILSFDVKATENTKYRAYVEAKVGTTYINHGAREIQIATGDVQSFRQEFEFENLDSQPYLVLQLLSAGCAEFSNVMISPKDAAIKVQVSDFNVTSGAKVVVDADNGKNKFLELNGKDGIIARTDSILLSVQPKKKYKISYQVRGIGTGDSTGAHFFRLIPEDSIKNQDNWQDCFQRNQNKTVYFTTQAAQESIRLVAETRGLSHVYINNILLIPVDENIPAASILLDPPFNQRDGVLNSHNVKNITGKVVFDTEEVKYGVLKYQNTEKKVFSNDIFMLPLPNQGESVDLSLKCFDKNDKAIETITKKITFFAPFDHEVTFNEQGIAIVNGKRFFPLGHWETGQRGDLNFEMEFLKEAGLNTLMMRGADIGVLDLAKQKGMMIAKFIPERIAGNTPEEKQQSQKWFERDLKRSSKHPAVLTFFAADEMMWRGVPLDVYKDIYKFTRKTAPNIPIWVNEAPRGTVQELSRYEPFVDIYGIDIYPVPEGNSHSALEDKGVSAVGKYTDICMEVVNKCKPVWMILQSFSWEQYISPDKEVPYSSYPSYEQSRFMAYNAITHGATGLFYHYLGYSKKVNEEFWRDLRKVWLELNYLSPVLVSDTVEPAQLESGDNRVRILQKRHEDLNYFIVVNEHTEPLKLEFKVNGVKASKLYTLLEPETIEIQNHKFTVALAARGVKIWSEKPFESTKKIFKPETYRPYQVANNPVADVLKGANWIWYPEHSSTVGSVAYFQRNVKLNSPIKKAELYLTADDYYSLYINGELIGTDEPGTPAAGTNWTALKSFNLSELLKVGDNLIAIKARDGVVAPSGLIAALHIEYKNGEVMMIKTDSSWISAVKNVANWMNILGVDKSVWSPAEELAIYGAGPWKDRIAYSILGRK